MAVSPPTCSAPSLAPASQRVLRRAMHASDDYVITLEYVDSKGQRTRRVVSPIRFVGGNRFLALCLGRCEPRYFQLDRCSELSLQPAANYVMPVPITQAG